VPKTSNPPVSIVIPTYNGAKLLKAHLPAVIEASRSGDEIIVVDDASRDETTEWLSQKYDLKKQTSPSEYELWTGVIKNGSKKIELSLVVNQSNVRFGANANRGVKLAQHSVIFLINNDVSPTPEVIKVAVPHFEDPLVFAVGCHEIEKNLGNISGGKNKLWFERGLFVHSRSQDFETGEAAWASGGSGFFDREKWLALGGFSSAYYPAYWEDIDLSYRAKQRGWKVIFDQNAVVNHNHETTHTTVFGQRQIQIMSFKNGLEFLWRNGTLSQKLQHLLWMPYHLTFTSLRTRGAFLRGFARFLYT
jgi:GT2 family glycosyltransferase